MLCESDQKRYWHRRRIHGRARVFSVEHNHTGDETVSMYMEDVPVSGWTDPLSEVQDASTEPEALCRWIYPICLLMMRKKYPEVALFSPPPELVNQALYAEINFEKVRSAMALKRFARLKSPEARATLLAKALAMPNSSAGYAEQKFRGIELG